MTNNQIGMLGLYLALAMVFFIPLGFALLLIITGGD